MDDADEEGESDNGEGIGDGAQWTVFLGAGVAAMRVDVRVSSVARLDSTTNRSRGRVIISIN